MDNSKLIDTAIWVKPNSYKTISYKAKCKFTSPSKSQKFTANIAVARDEKITVSIIGLGIIEIAKALITPTRILVVDKFHRKVYDKDFSYIRELTGVDLDFITFQGLLINELPLIIKGESAEEGNTVAIKSILSPSIQVEYIIDKATHVFTTLKVGMSEGPVSNADMQLLDYQTIDGYNISTARAITINSINGNQEVTMNLDRFVFDAAVSDTFDIPSSYEVIR